MATVRERTAPNSDIVYHVGHILPWLAAAFLLFRVLDVLKPWPIRQYERLPGGYGIMADDVAAGVLGAAVLNLVYRLVW